MVNSPSPNMEQIKKENSTVVVRKMTACLATNNRKFFRRIERKKTFYDFNRNIALASAYAWCNRVIYELFRRMHRQQSEMAHSRALGLAKTEHVILFLCIFSRLTLNLPLSRFSFRLQLEIGQRKNCHSIFVIFLVRFISSLNCFFDHVMDILYFDPVIISLLFDF